MDTTAILEHAISRGNVCEILYTLFPCLWMIILVSLWHAKKNDKSRQSYASMTSTRPAKRSRPVVDGFPTKSKKPQLNNNFKEGVQKQIQGPNTKSQDAWKQIQGLLGNPLTVYSHDNLNLSRTKTVRSPIPSKVPNHFTLMGLCTEIDKVL